MDLISIKRRMEDGKVHLRYSENLMYLGDKNGALEECHVVINTLLDVVIGLLEIVEQQIRKE